MKWLADRCVRFANSDAAIVTGFFCVVIVIITAVSAIMFVGWKLLYACS